MNVIKVSFAFLLVFCLAVRFVEGQDRKAVEAGKAASMLVELKGKSTYASAFCIHPSGFFVTNDHVVESMAVGDTLSLTMNSGTEDQKAIEAKLIRRDAENDLALLKYVGDPIVFPTLKLAQSPSVYETMHVAAFGFPFGIGLALEEDSSPAISVSVGRITAIRRDKKGVQLLQLDATLNPGNSGGAVIDETGEVIGVVSFGVVASGVNFAIPVEKLNQFLATPEVDLTIPNFKTGDPSKPEEIVVAITPILGQLEDASVEFWLKKGEGVSQKFELAQTEKNRFVRSVNASEHDSSMERNCQFEFLSGKIEAKVGNQALSINGKEYLLFDVRRIDISGEQVGGQAMISLTSGESLNTPIHLLPEIKIDFGDYPTSVNLTKAKKFEVLSQEVHGTLSYIVIVKNEGKEVYRNESTVVVEDVPAVASDTLEVNSVIATGPTSVSPLPDGSLSIPMPGTITDVVQAQGGNILLITLGSAKKLVVLDLTKASIVKVLPLASDNVLVAGTMHHIVIMDRGRNIIERYAIRNFERETAMKPPFAGVVKSITAGHASQGPILAHISSGTEELSAAFFAAIDLKSFKKLPIEQDQIPFFSSFRDSVRVRASANGRLFGLWATSHSPQGILSIALDDKTMRSKYEHDSAGHVVPTADGKYLLTGVRGVYTAELKNLSGNVNQGVRVPCVPTSHPRFYASIPTHPEAPRNLGSDFGKGLRPGIHEIGSEAALIDLPDLKLSTASTSGTADWAVQELTLDKRVYLNLSLNRLVSIPFTNDSVLLQHFDFLSELKNSELDYFFVSSNPVPTFSPGKTYSYQITVESNKKQVKYELASGPEKMQVSTTGKVTWNVPSKFKEQTVDVLVTITNGESMQTYESFTINAIPK